MSHAIYQTSAVILKTKNMRESNKLLVLYTEKFGLIYVSTQSVRELKSKMRFHTNTLSLVEVDLVRGRDIWKLTGIHEQYSSLVFAGTRWYSLVHRLAVLLLRLCSGEEPHDEVWQDLKKIYTYLQEQHALSKLDYEAIEIIFVTRLLYYLGYWEGEEEILSSKDPFSKDIYPEIFKNKNYFIQRINEGIQSSQL